MTINTYVKKWCDEDYDVRQEDFYVENAYYVASREWAISGFKHGWLALLIAVLVGFFNNSDVSNMLLNAGVTLGILTIAFWFYGIRNYDANSIDTGAGCYVFISIFMFITKNKMPEFVLWIFAILSFALYIYISWFRPIQFLSVIKKMKKRMRAMEQEEERSANDSYEKWKKEYEAYRYGLPNPEQPTSKEDPAMIEAKRLFDGYTHTKDILKTRYRQLAKQYHPDKGGDTKLFQCIIQVYEEFCQELGK